MSYVQSLRSKGLSPAGAVEVALGVPVTNPSDRALATRLALPGAAASLRQPAPPRTSSAPGRLQPSEMVEKVVIAMVTGNVLESTLEFYIGLASQPAGSTDPARMARINHLKNEMAKIQRQLKEAVDRLLDLLAHPPQFNSRKPAWEADILSARLFISVLKQTLAIIAQQLAAA